MRALCGHPTIGTGTGATTGSIGAIGAVTWATTAAWITATDTGASVFQAANGAATSLPTTPRSCM
jgi:PDZ domain-containing secreted protein